ncbi:MAG TPA: hypothetical protein PK913_08060 [Phenylobacterium sp.]|jgi:hypothetical protein|nr:hypothetical protein [Phenylobacterium sp.]
MTAQLATLRPQSAPALTGARQIGLTPQSIDEALRMAEIMSRASIVPKDYQGNPGNILVAIQWGAEIGLPPLQAMQNLAVINGRPALWGDAVIALVRGSGLLETIHEDITADVATCTVKRKGEPPASRSFSVEDAKRAGLYGKQGPWQQYPKRMLQMRARAWALRDVFPDVLRGVHVGEEAQDMPPIKAMGDAEIIPADPPATPHASRTEQVKARLAAGKAKPSTAPVMGDGQPQEPGPDLPMVLSLIRDAGTEEELHGAAEMAGRLTSPADKEQARKAYKARQKAMQAEAEAERKREAEEEARLEREAIQAEGSAADDAAMTATAADFFAGTEAA